ncbi:unnamed protein product [Pleuronectes platessa]|uniref:Uncharacterized protein n=1 Tax=Pleuronectes platessa TaxID=8262 RepID=A0A9N7YX96_PLEPL|nr:unnamed protein product [Pleuronectes platessa]
MRQAFPLTGIHLHMRNILTSPNDQDLNAWDAALTLSAPSGAITEEVLDSTPLKNGTQSHERWSVCGLEAGDKYIIAWRTAANNPTAASESELSPAPQPNRLAP